MIVHRRLRLLAFPTRTSAPRMLTLANHRSRFPSKARRTCQCLRPRRAGSGARVIAPIRLPSVTGTTSAPRIRVFRGSMAGLCAPLSALLQCPRGPCASLGVDAVRYSFIVMALHHLLLAVSRRTPVYPEQRTSSTGTVGRFSANNGSRANEAVA